jgi:putative peptidoglycan lipid II flippase
LRDVVLALVPEASRAAFIVAFKLPNMLRDLVGEGASNAAFVPVFSEVRHTRSEEEFRALVAAAMSAMLMLLGGLTLLGVVLAPMLLQGINSLGVFTGGDPTSPEDIDRVVHLTRWTFPYLFFIGMTVFAMGALYTVKHYSTPSWSPALLNISIIGSVLLFMNRFEEPAHALVLGVWVGGVAQMAVQFWALRKHTGVLWPNFRLTHPGVLTILALMAPVVIGQAAGEVNKLVDTLFAYKLGAEAVTALYYANRLVQLPLAVFGMAAAAAVLPSASQAHAAEDPAEVRRLLLQGMRMSAFLVFPSTIGLMIFGEPIVRLLFQHRATFTGLDTERTATALLIYGAALPAFAWIKVLVTGFYAAQDTRTPVLISAGSMLLNIVLNLLLVRHLGYKGLALATSIAFIVNVSLLYILLTRRYGAMWDTPMITMFLRIGAAAGVMGAVAYGAYLRIAVWMGVETLFARFIEVAAILVVSCIVYFGLCFILGVDEARRFANIIRRKT